MCDTDYSGYVEPGTRLIVRDDGQRWAFDPGSFGLELLTTGGLGTSQRYELLRTPVDVVGWLTESRLTRAAPIYPEQVQVRPSELRRIKELRDTLWEVAVTVVRGEQPDPAQLDLINACAVSPARLELEPTTAIPRWAPMTGTQILGSAAGDAIALIGDERGRLRICQGDDCRLLFLDTSRPGKRRWCSMSRCGNREKVRAYRRRSAGRATGAPAA